VASKLGSILAKSGRLMPEGFILESPFSRMVDEISSFYASKLLPFDILNQARTSGASLIRGFYACSRHIIFY
jgi:hypothetical protein